MPGKYNIENPDDELDEPIEGMDEAENEEGEPEDIKPGNARDENDAIKERERRQAQERERRLRQRQEIDTGNQNPPKKGEQAKPEDNQQNQNEEEEIEIKEPKPEQLEARNKEPEEEEPEDEAEQGEIHYDYGDDVSEDPEEELQQNQPVNQNPQQNLEPGVRRMQIQNQRMLHEAQRINEDPALNENGELQQQNGAKRKRVNPFKGTVKAQDKIEGSLLDKQEKEIHTLRVMTRELKNSSPEYQVLRKHLFLLDVYMKKIAGRTKLTKEEMERYELLTMRVYKATEIYERSEKAKLGNRKPTQKEKNRLLGIKEIQRSLTEMRGNLYENDLQKKKEDMQKKCREKMQDTQETLDGLYKNGAKNQHMREVLGGAVVRTLFYMNRMDSLEKNIGMKAGQSYRKTEKRMDRELKPTKNDFDNIAKMELTKSIVDAGMKAIKAGDNFSVDDIEKLQKEYIRQNAKRLAQQQKRRRNLQRLRRNTQPELNRSANRPHV